MTTQKGSSFSRGMKRTALSMALGMCFVGGVQAQSTTGVIRGAAPAGTTVVITNDSGFNRTVTADAQGRYSLGSLLIGNYTVTAEGVGKREVTVTVGGATDVSFASGATTLDTVNVVGANVPSIDVTSTSTSTVITAAQLARLPLSQSAEAIALLSPGAVGGNNYQFGGSNHGGTVAFGGASVAENAYYTNGFFSGTPTTNVGGYSLPYGAIEQQETYTGGYSAKYGRSDGGVINQIGKSGTNEVHFGGAITYAPKGLKAGRPDRYLPNDTLPQLPDGSGNYEYETPENAGKLYTRGDDYESWSKKFSGYVGGPLIKDKLFAFVLAEVEQEQASTPPSVLGAPRILRDKSTDPKVYAKLNWNINDSNLLEYTYLGRQYEYRGHYSAYDFATGNEGAPTGALASPVRENDEYSIFKYTSYLTDNLTFNATYGRSRLAYVSTPALGADVPLISGGSSQNPAYWPAGTPASGITNNQTSVTGTNARDYTSGLRAELEWVVGDHTLTAGVDNMKFTADNEGQTQLGTRWIYSTGPADENVSEELGVGVPGSPYKVDRYTYSTSTSMSLKQEAYYLEDRWQVTDNVLLTLGLRNDKFTNSNIAGEPYAESGDQWAPRIGASWDVFGDSSLKIFANAGRYFLALPNNVAVRGAASAYYTDEYFTYSGINPDGSPTGLTPVPGVNGAPAPGEVSGNNEFGQAKDPATVAATNLKSEYQDEFLLGFEKTLGDKWSYGASLTYRDLKSAVDDVCDPDSMVAKLEANGVDLNTIQDPHDNYCWLFNPNATNSFDLANGTYDADGNFVPSGGYTSVNMSPSDWGWPSKLKRTYKAVNLFLEHPFDGKWEARLDYTYSKNEGNTEGPANTDTGQGGDEHDSGVSLSQNWDGAGIMAFADGYLPNDRRHQFKARGSYAINSEWLVSGNLSIMSGTPINCFGYYSVDGAPESDPVGYYSSYHTCFGEASPPGKKYTSWTRRLDLGVTYRPAYFDDMLALGLQVFNVTNERETIYVDGTAGVRAGINTTSNTYGLPLTFQTPRYVMFSVSLDY